MEKVLIVLVAVIFTFGAGFAFWGIYNTSEALQSTTSLGTMQNPAWCKIADLDIKGGTFASPEPGNNEYIVLQYGDSLEIYQRCTSIE